MGESLAAVTGGLFLSSALFQRQAALQNAEGASKAHRFNAQLAEMEASSAATRARRIADFETSKEIVDFRGKSGVLLEGSPLRFITANALEREREALNIEIAGARTAALERAAARNARIVGRQQAGAALISGLASAGAFGSSILLKRG